MKTTSKGHAKLSHGFADFCVTPLDDTACGGVSTNREKHFQEHLAHACQSLVVSSSVRVSEALAQRPLAFDTETVCGQIWFRRARSKPISICSAKATAS